MKPQQNSSGQIIPSTALRIVEISAADLSRDKVMGLVADRIRRLNQVSVGTTGKVEWDPRKAEVYLAINPLRERIWFVRSSDWTFTLDSASGKARAFSIPSRQRAVFEKDQRNMPVTIRNTSAALTTARRYCDILEVPWVPPLRELRWLGEERGGILMIDVPPATVGNYPIYTDVPLYWPYTKLIVDTRDAALIQYAECPPVHFVTTQQKVSPETAVQLANQVRQGQAHRGSPKLYYTIPQTYKRPDGTIVKEKDVLKERPLPLHLSWVVYLTGAKSAPDMSGAVFTCIDAETGEFIRNLKMP